MATVIGFDFGTKSIGIAVGQTITGTASPLKALPAKEGQPDWNALEKIIKEWQPDYAVVGLPLAMDGTDLYVTKMAEKFAGRLHGRFGIKVEMKDERLTTKAARDELFQRGGFRALKKGSVDSGSAVLILEGWFEEHPEF